MIKHYIILTLLFYICIATSRRITTVATDFVGVLFPRYGQNAARDVWELRRYVYAAYPVIQARERYYHHRAAYPVWPYDGNEDSWSRFAGAMHITMHMFPYYRTYTYFPKTDLMEPTQYEMNVRIGTGSLLYNSSTRAWMLYSFDLQDYLDDYPVLIASPD